MSFALKDLQWGDDVFILVKAIKRIWQNELITRIANMDDNAAIRCLATFTGDGKLYIMNPDIGQFPIELITLKNDIACVKRNDELLYPKAFLTDKERKFLSGLKPIFTKDTLLMKVQCSGGRSEFIKLRDVKSNKADTEIVDLPCYPAGKYYRGLNAGEFYTLDSLGLPTSEE